MTFCKYYFYAILFLSNNTIWGPFLVNWFSEYWSQLRIFILFFHFGNDILRLFSYIYRRLKAKRALFKGRSLSLASFTLPVPKFLPLVRQRSSKSPGKVRYRKTEQNDEKYLEENRPQGELEILALESLIDLNDVKKDANKTN